MAIEMKHGANPASVLGAKFAGGRGEQLGKTKLKGLDILDRQTRQNSRQDFLSKTEENRNANKLELLDRKQSFSANESDRDRLFDREDTLFNAGLDRDMFDYELTAEQKHDEEKLRNEIYKVQNNPDFSPDEKVKAVRMLEAKAANIEPIFKRQDPSRHPKGQGPGDVWFDEGNNRQFSMDLEGNTEVKDTEKRGLSDKDKIDISQQSFDLATDSITNVVNPEKANEYYQQRLKMIGYGPKPDGVGQVQEIVDRAKGLSDASAEGGFGPTEGQPVGTQQQDVGQMQQSLSEGGFGPVEGQPDGVQQEGPEATIAEQEVVEVKDFPAPSQAYDQPALKIAWNKAAGAVEASRDKLNALRIGSENGQIESLDSLENELTKAKEALATEVKAHGKQGSKKKPFSKRKKETYFSSGTRDARQKQAKEEIKALEQKRNGLKDMEDALKIKEKADLKRLQLLKDSTEEAT